MLDLEQRSLAFWTIHVKDWLPSRYAVGWKQVADAGEMTPPERMWHL